MSRVVRMAGLLAVAITASGTLSGCGAIPQPRRDIVLEQSANTADVSAILGRYREVRNTAISLLDPKPLSIVETGPVLAIDTGSFDVAQRLSRTQPEDQRQLQIGSVETPRFSQYPLWFMVTAFDPASRVDVVQIFERLTPVDPWLLVAAPQTLPSTRLPGLRRDGDNVIPVAASNGKGMAMSPQRAAASYAKALASMSGSSAGVARDDFIRKMRASFDQANRLEGVRVTQTWAAERVEHALRTDDGGALVWVTLLRLDTYTVQPGIKVSWPDGSPQQAFLANGISGSGKLRYYHQVLLHVPGGSGEPRALGHYGGVVSANAQAALAPVPAPGQAPNSLFPADPFPIPTPSASASTDAEDSDDEDDDEDSENTGGTPTTSPNLSGSGGRTRISLGNRD